MPAGTPITRFITALQRLLPELKTPLCSGRSLTNS
jgi:hypothetical protein